MVERVKGNKSFQQCSHNKVIAYNISVCVFLIPVFAYKTVSINIFPECEYVVMLRLHSVTCFTECGELYDKGGYEESFV